MNKHDSRPFPAGAWWQFIMDYDRLPASSGVRMGQHFCNTYIEQPWPELYYETNPWKAMDMIVEWLQDNQYYDKLPEKVNRWHSIT